jgi:hypothetical protein
MPTEVISTIGATSSPVTPDYTSIQSWEDDIPSDLTTTDEIHIGECLDQGTLGHINIAGQTTDSTRYIVLRCASGASFKDKAGVRDGKLNYDDTDGVKCESNSQHSVSTAYTKIEGLKIYRPVYVTYCFAAGGRFKNIDINQCIFKGSVISLGGPSSINFPNNNSVIRNCLFHHPDVLLPVGGDGSMINCTVRGSVYSAYNLGYIKNCLVFGSNGFLANGTDTYAGSDYNATNNSSAGAGNNNLTSLTMSDEIESTTDDFRPKKRGSLKAASLDSLATEDITGFSRIEGSTWIGAFDQGDPVFGLFTVLE